MLIFSICSKCLLYETRIITLMIANMQTQLFEDRL